MAWLGALAQLDLDHLDLAQRRRLAEFLIIEMAVRIAATEISAA